MPDGIGANNLVSPMRSCFKDGALIIPIQTRWVAMPSLMVARWVGQNPVLFFAVCGPKCTELSVPVRECPYSVVFDWRCLVALRRYSRSSRPKSGQNFDVFGPPNFGRKGPSKFLTEFYKSRSPSNMWQSSVAIGQATSEIRRQKKKT